VSGDGPLDVVFAHAAGIPIDLLSEDPGFIRLRKRLGTFSRAVGFDRRGEGASEGDPRDTFVGEISDADLTAVLDAVGFERRALVAEGTSSGRAIHFSATHPDRVSALVLVNGYAHYVREDGYPWGFPPTSLDRLVAAIRESWGTAAALETFAPSRVSDERFRAWFARSARSTGGPDQTADMVRADLQQDVRRFSPPSRFPPWSSIAREIATSTWVRAATWPNTSPTPSSWFFLATITRSSWVTPTPWRTRSRSS
jgi:pimeloyl-ACP methyl ester carboxylesterase